MLALIHYSIPAEEEYRAMASGDSSSREVLNKKLSELLGFDDVSDVLDYLLSIESSEVCLLLLGVACACVALR